MQRPPPQPSIITFLPKKHQSILKNNRMNLIKKIVFCTLLLGISFICTAQEISIRGGLNISQIELFNFDSQQYTLLKLGYRVGPCFNIPINKALSIETGVFYSTKGFRHKHTESDETGSDEISTLARLNLAYLETPLALKVKIFSRDLTLYGFGGGYFAPALIGSLYGRIEDGDGFREKITWKRGGEYSLKRFDYGATMGFEVQKDKFRMGISYSLGFANLSYTNQPAYNKNLELYLGYQLSNKE